MIRLPKWLVLVLAVALVVAFATPLLAAEAKGKIKSITADKKEFVLTDKDAKDRECVMADDAKIKLNDKDAKLNELKEGDEVTITYEEKDGKWQVSKLTCKRE